jgi:hypothetical protein
MTINLHKEYGLNPTIGICPICQRDNGEIMLLGNKCKDKAPMRSWSPNVCKECGDKYLTNGVLLIGVDGPNKLEARPTGDIVVLTIEAFKRAFQTETVPPGNICYIDTAELRRMVPPPHKVVCPNPDCLADVSISPARITCAKCSSCGTEFNVFCTDEQENNRDRMHNS